MNHGQVRADLALQAETVPFGEGRGLRILKWTFRDGSRADHGWRSSPCFFFLTDTKRIVSRARPMERTGSFFPARGHCLDIRNALPEQFEL
jgi:hypothetical protein